MVGMQLTQQLRLTQQLVMTPQLRLAIQLLQVTRLELADMVQQELTENPVLEEGVETQGSDTRQEGDQSRPKEAETPQGGAELERLDRKESREAEKETTTKAGEEVDWDRYLENHANQPPMPSSIRRDSDELPGLEATLTKGDNLFDHLLWQVRMASFVEDEKRFAVLVIGNLDRDGYLSSDVTVAELAEEAGLDVEDAEEVLLMVQDFDPVGVGARDLRECLLAQVRVLELDEDVEAIVDRHLDDVEGRRFKLIARELGISLEDVHDATKILATLDPRPGRNLTGDATNYVTPDVYVHKLNNEYFVVPNDDGMPMLRISGYYRKALAGNQDTRKYVQDKLRSAQWLIRSIEQRRRTIIKVTECIVEKQRSFFDDGIDYLRPMVLRDVADSVGLHESTISRVTNGKYMHTPRGIFELKYFFNPAIRRLSGEDVASESVKHAIKRCINDEDKGHPLSDQKIVTILAGTGIVIARRTVAKYRVALGILSSSRRRQTP